MNDNSAMPLRPAVVALLDAGQLPSEDAEVASIAKFERLITAIEEPLNRAEATELLAVFGIDDCYGLAWTLLHLIEASDFEFRAAPDEENEWVQRLWARQDLDRQERR